MSRPESRRVRHEVRLRHLTVQHVQHLTPKMYRVALGGSELAGFTSMGFDDHVKVFFPQPGQPKISASWSRLRNSSTVIGFWLSPRRMERLTLSL